MGRLLVGVSGALFGAALLAADAAPAATHGGWLPTLGALALGGLLGSIFGGSGFGAAFILTLLVVLAVIGMRVFGKARHEPAAPPQLAIQGAETAAAPQGPAGFDTAEFLRGAKLKFVKLQAARELGRLEQVRGFATPGMFDRLRTDRGAPLPDVIALNADLLEVAAEANPQLASVRFSGTARPAPGAAPVGFVEVWNLAKPAGGASGWLLAGIRQMH